MMFLKRCEYCGIFFKARRSTAKTCSGTCRVYYNRYKSELCDNVNLEDNVKTLKDNGITQKDNCITLRDFDTYILHDEVNNINNNKDTDQDYSHANQYKRSVCFKCGKRINIIKHIMAPLMKVVCDDCLILYFKLGYPKNKYVIDSEGQNVNKAYRNIINKNKRIDD